MNSELQINTPIKTNKLTKLERKWYKEYLECFNATDALNKAYPDNKYSGDSKYSIAYQTKKSVFSKLQIDEDKLMEIMGITNEKLTQKLSDKLEAKRAMIVNGKPFQVDDHQAQLKALELSYKLKGKLNDTQKVELTGKNGEPLSIQLLAGIGFLNKRDPDVKPTITEEDEKDD